MGEFIQLVPMSTKTSDAANDFYTRMVKQGFDAVLDTNDAYGLASTQDPLIIFNMEKLGNVKSVKLTKDDLDSICEYTSSKAYKQKKKNVSQIAHTASTSYRDGEHMRQNELYHWGIKGMKWGVRRYQNKDGSLTPAGKKRYSQNDSPSEDYVRAHTKKPISQMSDQELRTVNNRLQMENQLLLQHLVLLVVLLLRWRRLLVILTRSSIMARRWLRSFPKWFSLLTTRNGSTKEEKSKWKLTLVLA